MFATELSSKLPNLLKCVMEDAKENEASKWLIALPIAEHSFFTKEPLKMLSLCNINDIPPSYPPTVSILIMH